MPYKDPTVRKAKAREIQRRWRLRHPEYRERRKQWPSYLQPGTRLTDEAAAAQVAVRRAILKGILTRPSVCENCGESGFIEAAHKNYAFKLDVLWLCRSCHRKRDAATPLKGRTSEPRKGRPIQTADERRAYRAAWARQDRAKKRLAKNS